MVWLVLLALIFAVFQVAWGSIIAEDTYNKNVYKNATINMVVNVAVVIGSFIYAFVNISTSKNDKGFVKELAEERWGAFVPYPTFFLIGYSLFMVIGWFLAAKLNTRRLIRGRHFSSNFRKTKDNPHGVGYEYHSRTLRSEADALKLIKSARGAGRMYAESWPYGYRNHIREVMGVTKELKPTRTEKLAKALIKEEDTK